jgi:iron complex transport system ATP-binding protein
MVELTWREVEADRGGSTILRGVSLQVRTGELVALIGPNGAGKTTLLQAGLGLFAVHGGTVRLDGADPRRMPAAERARRLAYLPQTRTLAWPLQVEAVVALGRFAHGAPLQRPRGADAAAIARALAACRLEGLAGRRVDALSGGELARVHMARALAAEAPLLLADEPAASLDPLHAFETLSILKAFCAAGGGALVTLHDLSLALRFADRIALLHQGRLLAEGPAAEVVTPALLAQAYGVRAEITGAGVAVLGPT